VATGDWPLAWASLNAGCFAAGMKMLTREGWRKIEEIVAGEEVASRAEGDLYGDADWKAVEATFRRTACVAHLHADGQVIRTTLEHPFWADGKGWTAAGSLKQGDRIATLSGEWVTVEELYDTGEWEPVYNLRVADWHTYFVGDDNWGWAAWAHNSYQDFIGAIDKVLKQKRGTEITDANRGIPGATLQQWYNDYNAGTITQSTLIARLDRSLKITGRTQVTAIINAATLDNGTPRRNFAQRIQAAADSAVGAQITALQQLLVSIGVTDAQIGYRGSVARGTKTAEKGGYPVDWDDVDVDLFIVSDQLAQIVGNKAFLDQHSAIGGAVGTIQISILNAINTTANLMPSGKAINSSKFLVVTQVEFDRRLAPSFFNEGQNRIPQANPARIVTLGPTGNVIVTQRG